MIDLHCHVLPQLDDGCGDAAASLALAAEAEAAGVEILVATPHVRDDYPTRPETIAAAVEAISESLAKLGARLQVVTGAEIALDRVPGLDARALGALSLGGNGHYVLVEFPYAGWPRAGEPILADLGERGFRAVLAHPERNDAVQDEPSRLARLLESTGALVQVTIGSFSGRHGARARSTAFELLDRGLVHVAASDVHRPGAAAVPWTLPESVPRRTVDELTVHVPRAILAAEPVEVSTAQMRRRWSQRFRRGQRG